VSNLSSPLVEKHNLYLDSFCIALRKSLGNLKDKIWKSYRQRRGEQPSTQFEISFNISNCRNWLMVVHPHSTVDFVTHPTTVAERETRGPAVSRSALAHLPPHSMPAGVSGFPAAASLTALSPGHCAVFALSLSLYRISYPAVKRQPVYRRGDSGSEGNQLRYTAPCQMEQAGIEPTKITPPGAPHQYTTSSR